MQDGVSFYPNTLGGRRRRCLLPIGVILRILDWAAMRGGYEDSHRFRWPDLCMRPRRCEESSHWESAQMGRFASDLEAAFRSWFIANDGRNKLHKSGGSNSRKQIVQLFSQSISAGNLVFSS